MRESEKSNNINVRISLDEIIAIKQSGMNISDFVRQSIQNELIRTSPNFLEKREKEIFEELEQIKQQKKLFELKKEESTNLTKQEIKALLESKKILETNPVFLEGRLNKFINEFGKSYKISKAEFINLMEEAEKIGIKK